MELMMSRPHRWAHPAPRSRSRRAAAAAARPFWRRSCVDVRYKPPTHLEPGSPRAVGRGGSRPARAQQPHSHAQQVRCLCCILVGLLSAEKFVERVDSTPRDDTVTTAGEDHVAKADEEAEAEAETTGSPSLVSSSSSDGSAESNSVSSLPTPAKQPPPQTEIAQGHGSDGAAADRVTSSAAATDVAPRLSLARHGLGSRLGLARTKAQPRSRPRPRP